MHQLEAFCMHQLEAIWARDYKTFFMLNSIEHEISNDDTNYSAEKFSCFQTLRCFIYHANIGIKHVFSCINIPEDAV